MKDYKLINPAIKELALENYYSLTGDKKILEAFSHSKLVNLSAKATELMDAGEERVSKNKVFDDLVNLYHLNFSQLAYISNWGLQWSLTNKKRANVLSSTKTRKEQNPYLINMNLGADGTLVIDGFAMAMLVF